MINQVGQQIGNYRLVKTLGKGGFAQVWLGEHLLHLQEYAALKILTALDTQAQQMFLKEAKIIKKFSHPHIIKLFDYTIENSIPVIIMDYAPNDTLEKKHPRGQIVPLATILEYLKPIASAIDYAHKQGIIHRDIKPANILIGAKNEVLLSDFGVAATAHRAQTMKTGRDYAGTLCYSAPEQINGAPCPASDQYTMGVIVYQWLSGTLPFPYPAPLRQRVPAISPAVEAVVMKALEQDPIQRFESVWKFAKALELAVNQPSLSAATVLATSTVQASPVVASTIQPSPVVQPSPAVAPTIQPSPVVQPFPAVAPTIQPSPVVQPFPAVAPPSML
jgi:serine/threonine protein kinase